MLIELLRLTFVIRSNSIDILFYFKLHFSLLEKNEVTSMLI